MARSTACRLTTGNAPGSPRQTGQTFVFGAAPNSTGQPQKILVFVPSWTCTSSPMTGSYFVRMESAAAAKAMFDSNGGPGSQQFLHDLIDLSKLVLKLNAH